MILESRTHGYLSNNKQLQEQLANVLFLCWLNKNETYTCDELCNYANVNEWLFKLVSP